MKIFTKDTLLICAGLLYQPVFGMQAFSRNSSFEDVQVLAFLEEGASSTLVDRQGQSVAWQAILGMLKRNPNAILSDEQLDNLAQHEVLPRPSDIRVDIKQRTCGKRFLGSRPEEPDLTEQAKHLTGIPDQIPRRISQLIEQSWMTHAQNHLEQHEPEFKHARACRLRWKVTGIAMVIASPCAAVGLIIWAFASALGLL